MKRHSSRASSSESPSPTSKASRISDSTLRATAAPLFCTLPPTCNTHPTAVANTRELEAHYAKYHAWVCLADEAHGKAQCGKVFPDGRLLELHQTECHDPIAAVKKDRGEKIFACFLPSSACNKLFQTPKARRLHLIAAHAYPKEYFFAVVNKGVGGLLAKWGDGAGMVRGEWKSRTDRDERKIIEGEREETEDTSAESASELKEEEEENDLENHSTSVDMDIDKLTSSFQSSLSIAPVPSSIRFGRGTSRGGRARGGRGHYASSVPSKFKPHSQNDETSSAASTSTTDPSSSTLNRRARGGARGGRGRARGRGGFDGGFIV